MARPRTDIEPRIVHAARARFLAEGVDGASLRTIARDAGTSVGMVSYYFPTKDDLFLAVVEEIYEKLLVDLETALSGTGAVRPRLTRAFARLGRLDEVELSVVRLVVREALLSTPRFDRIFARFRRGHLGMLLQTLSSGVASGEIDGEIPLPLLLIATFAMGGAPQLVRHAIAGRPPPFGLPEPEQLAMASTELLFRAIGRDESSAPAKPRKTKKTTGTARRKRT